MKKNNKGFMLVETIIVTVVVSTIMVSLYIAFNKIYNAYENKKSYSDIEPVYTISTIRNYLIDEFLINDIIKNITNNEVVDIISNKEIKLELKDYQKEFLTKIKDNYNITELQIIKNPGYYLNESTKNKLIQNKKESYKNYINYLEEKDEFINYYYNDYLFIIEESTSTKDEYIYGCMSLQEYYDRNY